MAYGQTSKPDKESRIYTRCRHAENVLWDRFLKPLVMEIDSDVYKSRELHARAEKLTRGLSRIFQKGCETVNYATDYSGPLQEAYDMIDKVNKKIELRNNSNGFERMPYIEIGGVYPIFEKCLEKAKAQKQQTNDKIRAITMEEYLWQLPMPQSIPSSLTVGIK